jgi:neutral/alkaline ceramidase-like enzyme
MKTTTIWILALVGSIAVAGTVTAQKVTSLQAGAAAVDITPREFPIRVRGRVREQAHDALHSRALVFSDSATTLAIVVVDNLGVAEEACTDAKRIANKRCGIAPENIMIASTHTHSAPSSNATEGEPVVVAYRKVIVEGMAESIVQAHGLLRPASIGTASHPLPEEVSNRRWFLKPGKMTPNPWGLMDEVKTNAGQSEEVLDRPAGPIDPDVTVLSVHDARRRKPIAMFANYALHYVGGLPEGRVSADYFGEFCRLMPTRVRGGDDFVAMMSNGASGDINNLPRLFQRPPREPGEQLRIIAGKTADAAWFAWKKIDNYQTSPPIGMIERPITLALRRPSAAQIESAKATLAITDKGELARLPKKAESYARKTMSMRDGGQTTVPLQAIRLGDTALCAIPFETFAEIGLELKERSPFKNTIVVGIANGYNGYLPTPEQHKLGGYETWLGTCRVQEDASVLIIDQLLEMLAELKME